MNFQQPPQLPLYQTLIKPIVIVQPAEPSKPKPVLYKVVKGDTLTKIAKAHKVPLTRLWAANRQLDNPDVIKPNMSLKIPHNSDKLKARPLFAKIKKHLIVSRVARTDKPLSRGFSVSGNTYTPGYCTWGVKNWLPWVPNNWGHAYAWANNARSQGYTVSYTPRVGAVAQTTAGAGHVAVVIGVGKGSVTIKEMNYRTLYDTNTRTVPDSSFVYIYP